MSFFGRITNIWRGFLSLWVSDLETRNPEAVYEAAIEERVNRHRELKKAVSGIVYLRNKLSAELDQKENEYREIQVQIPIAVEEGDDDVALILLQKKDELEARIAQLQIELEQVSSQAEEAKSGLVAFQGEIEKLRREKDEMLARKATAEARIEIQDTLDGLSTEADIKALDNVRTHIDRLQAEADVGSEIRGESLDDKLARIKARAGDQAARSQLDELKRQMAARRAAQGQAAGQAAASQAAASPKKTM